MPSGARPDPVIELDLRQACARLEARLRAGDRCGSEDLLAESPALAACADAALELIYTEFVLREELGQHPPPAAWYARFPHYRADLEQLFQVHQAVRDRPGGDSTGGPDTPVAGPVTERGLRRRRAGPHGRAI